MQKSKLLIHLLLRTAQDFTHQIKKCATLSSTRKALAKVTSEHYRALTQHEDILNQYLSTLPMRTVLEGITSGRYLQ